MHPDHPARVRRAAFLPALSALLMSALSISCLAQSGLAPPTPMRDVAGTHSQAATINLMEARLAALEKKLAELEQKLATQQAKQAQHGSELDALKFLPNAFKNHSHDVVIHTIDYSLAEIKDTNGIKKMVVVPGPSWGNPKGQTGGPKVAPGQPF